MEEFLKRLETTTVPENYEKRFVDILDAVGEKSILTIEERETLALIIAYYWVKEYTSPATKNSKAKAKVARTTKLPFDGLTLTKSHVGYRIALNQLPAKLIKQLFAYVYEIAG